MADVQRSAPGAWPYGKSKGSASDAPATQDKGVQQPEVEKAAEDEPASVKNEAGQPQQPQNPSEKAGDQGAPTEKAETAPLEPATPAPAKDETVTNGGYTNGDAHDDAKSRITNGHIPEDEGKDMTEPDDIQRQQHEQQPEQPSPEQQEEQQDEKGSITSGLSNVAQGAKNIVPTSLAGSDKDADADTGSQQEKEGDQTEPEPPKEGSEVPEKVEEEAEDAKETEEVSEEAKERPEDLKEVEPEPVHEEVEQAEPEVTQEPQEIPGEADTKPEDLEAAAKSEQAPIEAETPTEEAVPEAETDKQAEEQAPEGEIEKAEDAVPEGEIGPEGDAVPDEAQKEAEAAASDAENPTEEGEQQQQEEEALQVDFSVLKGCKVNKGGNVVNEDGEAVGRIVEGIVAHLIGRKVDQDGIIWNDNGKQIGKAEPIPENELQNLQEVKPFESFEDNTIDGKGFVLWKDEQVGKVVEGDLKVLRGRTVDPDGEVLDKSGNIIGKAERWEPEPEAEPEPEPEVDRSILAGKRVNKLGNIVDSNGTIFGRVVEGDPKRMIGRMCNKQGEILSESGDVLGKADVVPEGEREGLKEGPFAELSGLTVTREGKVVTPGGDVVGRVIKGDAKILAGRPVDEDGDILDKNGNSLGKAERWEEPEVEKEKGPMAGLRVNREGNVVDKEGNVIGKLTSGDLSICSGKEIDDDGDVVNSKGQTVGHVNLVSEIPPEIEEGETEEEKEKREQLEKDKKLAVQMSVCLEQCLDKIKPICKLITEKIDKAERTPEDDRDEEGLVKEVRPLIEEGGKILQEAHGVIRGLDPDGRIQANAKHKSATREATGEEYHLADVLKEITGEVTQTIEAARKKLEDMPHAKKELNPLWGLLSEPLFQIIAAVGLLLNGVLSLVGRLLSGLGLGGLVDNLLGGLGLTRVLDSLGLGSAIGALTGKNKKKK